jgi:hypothetical protein
MTTEKTRAEHVANLLKDAKITSTERDKIIESLYFDKDGVLMSFYAEPLLKSMTVKEYDDFLKKAGSNFSILPRDWYGWIWNRQTQTCDHYQGGVCYTGGCSV